MVRVGAYLRFHHPWQKPTVESASGLIREFLPKGTGFSKVVIDEAHRGFGLINVRSKKALG